VVNKVYSQTSSGYPAKKMKRFTPKKRKLNIKMILRILIKEYFAQDY